MLTSVSFSRAALTSEISFGGATFKGRVSFDEVRQSHCVDLDGAILAAETLDAEHTWPPGWRHTGKVGSCGGTPRQTRTPGHGKLELHSTGVESTTHTSSLHTEEVVARIRLTLRIRPAALRSRLL